MTPTQSQAISIWWEDLRPGTVRELGTASVSEQEIKEFAAKYDPQPFHLDEEAGRRSLFGGLCASGWQTCGLAMRLTVDNLLKHTDSKGSDSYNLRLSRARANSVRSYLITQGVEGSRLTAQGFGETQPVASNTSEEGRAENRRVEFKVIKQ